MTSVMGREAPFHVNFGNGLQVLLLVLAALTLPAALLINRDVPYAYMDEEFHVRQVQHYCRGDFDSWDPKITTFPGLYIMSLAYLQALLPVGTVLGQRQSINDICQITTLRSLNIALFFACALLFREIFMHLDAEKNMAQASLKALVLSLYPLHWFFNLLYYTEMGSATAVMAMYLASLKRAYWTSAMFGAISILFRQTNAVWTIFVLCVGILDFIECDPQEKDILLLEEHVPLTRINKSNENENQDPDQLGTFSALSPVYAENELRTNAVRKRSSFRQIGAITKDKRQTVRNGRQISQHSVSLQGLTSEIWDALTMAWSKRLAIVWNFSPLALVFVAFVSFTVHAGSIVVGDRRAHMVSLHFTQVFYCGLVCAGFQAALYLHPWTLSNMFLVVRTYSRKTVLAWSIIACIIGVICIHYFSEEHPYLIADNRHYIFYLWKDILQRHWTAKYVYIPLYLFSWWSILFMIGRRKKVLWVAAFCLAVVGVLVPSPLLELRYFNIPFYLIFLHNFQEVPHERYTLALTGLQFMTVNIATVYIFLFWPFEWTSEPERLQRFMW